MSAMSHLLLNVLVALCLATGCVPLHNESYVLVSGTVVKPNSTPAAFCDLYLAPSEEELQRGPRLFDEDGAESFGVKGENCYHFVKTDEKGRFQTVLRIRREGRHPSVFYTHPLPRLALQVMVTGEKGYLVCLDTEWCDWGSDVEKSLEPARLGSLRLKGEPKKIPLPKQLRRSFLKPIDYPYPGDVSGRVDIKQGRGLFDRDDFKGAADCFRRASHFGSEALPLFLAAESLFRAKSFHEARKDMDRALRLNPFVGRGWLLDYLILDSLGNKEKAKQSLLLASQFDPNLYQAFSRLIELDPRFKPLRKEPLFRD